MRTAIAALANSRRSIVAMMRPKRPADEVRRMETVLDIVVPFSVCDEIHFVDLGILYVYQMPEATGLVA